MKYLGKEPIFCTPPTPELEETWERVFGKKIPAEDIITYRSIEALEADVK